LRSMRKRKLPPVKQTRMRKGNHPSNPYAAEAATALRHEDRPGWPFPARRVDLTDEAQLGSPPPPITTTLGGEPTYILRASNPFSGMVLRFMANAAIALSIPPDEARKIRETALAMDLWRERNSGGG
jgi:hypothetical protein